MKRLSHQERGIQEKMKIVVKRGFDFDVSDDALIELAKRKGIKVYPQYVESDHAIIWNVPQEEWKDKPIFGDFLVFTEWAEYVNKNSFHIGKLERTDSDLIALIEEKGSYFVSGYNSELGIVEIPDGIEWEIAENDEFGDEWVEEKHRSWHVKP